MRTLRLAEPSWPFNLHKHKISDLGYYKHIRQKLSSIPGGKIFGIPIPSYLRTGGFNLSSRSLYGLRLSLFDVLALTVTFAFMSPL